MKYKLKQLFLEHNIKSLSSNSKKIKENTAFFAIRGIQFDGNQYINEALNNGAKLIFTDNRFYENKDESQTIFVENTKEALINAAEILYSDIPKNLIAVTGTNGKTSVVSYCEQLFVSLGEQSASIGTIGVCCSNKTTLKKFDEDQYKSHTTSDIVTFRQILSELAKDGINNVAFEASSHGIDQQRIGNLTVRAAAFTSFSQDHLDYHKTMQKYLDAKLKLFIKHLKKDGLAVISSEITEIKYIKDFLNQNNVDYLTVGDEGDIQIIKTQQSIEGQKIFFRYKNKEYNFQTEIIGSFQASNLLIAAALIEKFGFSFDNIIVKLQQVKAVKGRLERVTKINDPYQVFVDYSHTPDSLKSALVELNKIKRPGSKLIIVFGCGGNRDSGKRPIMGKIAEDYADIQIVTDDNPRFEDPSEIRKEVMRTLSKAIEIEDRIKAIDAAVDMLNKNDILLIAGKGHEDYQIIRDKKIPMDDIKTALNALEKKK